MLPKQTSGTSNVKVQRSSATRHVATFYYKEKIHANTLNFSKQ